MFLLLLIILLLVCLNNSFADIHRFTASDGTIIFTNLPNEKGGQIVHREKKANMNKKNSNTNTFKSESFLPIVMKKANEYNLDPQLIKSIIKAESNWNPYAVSPKGARGLMQLLPSTAYELGVTNSFDPEENIDGGVRYLKYLLDKFNGNLSLAIAAYNAGPGRVEKTGTIPPIPETIEFVRRVMSIYTGVPYFNPLYIDNSIYSRSDRREITKIRRFELQDGTILYTNSSKIFF